jgi:cytochrome c1
VTRRTLAWRRSARTTGAAIVLALASALLAACEGRHDAPRYVELRGDPDRGALLIRQFSCGACHTIPGVRGARGLVGPPLTSFAERTYIAGQLPNTARNLERWLRDPPAVEPGTAMPNLGLDEPAARDVAAYLLTLR